MPQQTDAKQAGGILSHIGVMLEVGNDMSWVRCRHLAAQLNAQIEVVWLIEGLYENGWQMYGTRSDKDWRIVDCISFVMMQERGLTETPTADQHFQQAGFITLL